MWSVTKKYIHPERKIYISSSFSFKAYLKCHPVTELFLGYTTKILPMALYHFILSISFIVHIALRKLINLLAYCLPHTPLALEHATLLFTKRCIWCLVSIWVREDTQYLSGWSQIHTAHRRGGAKTAPAPPWFLWESDSTRTSRRTSGPQGQDPENVSSWGKVRQQEAGLHSRRIRHMQSKVRGVRSLLEACELSAPWVSRVGVAYGGVRQLVLCLGWE